MKTVLIVDDEPDVACYLEMILRDNGYETATAVNGNDALERSGSQARPGHAGHFHARGLRNPVLQGDEDRSGAIRNRPCSS